MTSHHTRLERSSFGQAIRIAGCIAVAGLVLAADGPAARAQSDYASAATHSTGSASSSKPIADGRVKLNMQGASWHKALKRIARHAGIELVMKASPPGTFTCTDPGEHTIADALRLINRQLEPLGFRAIQQGNFLLLLNLDGLRSGYNSPSFVRFPQSEQAAPATPPAAAAAVSAPQPSGAIQVSATGSETGAAPALMELNPDGSAAGSTPATTTAPHSSDAATASSAGDSNHSSGEAEKDPKEPKTPLDEKIEKADTTPTIRLWYLSATWPQVLANVCEQSGLTLVAKKGPSGTVKFRDWKKYTTGEIIAILNQELDGDQSNFRLVRQDKFLLVINKDDLRSEYQRPTVGNLRHPVHSEVEMVTESRPATPIAPPVQSSAPAPANVVPAEANFPDETQPQRTPAIEPVRLEKAADAPDLLPAPSASETAAATPESAPAPAHGPSLLPRAAELVSPAPPSSAAPSPSHESGAAYTPQRRRVEALARKVYSALKTRSELMDAGPENLPGFRVFEAAGARSRVTFSVGIDTEHNRLVIDAPARKRSALRHILDSLDESEPTVDDNLRLVSADVPRAAIAKNVTTELNQLIAQNPPTPPVPSPDGAPGRATIQVAPGQQQNLSELIKGLKGEVTVESVPDLGILILRGNPADVEAVMKVIREVERLSRGQAPQIQILSLKYVNSESFARLLNSVYQDLHGLRTSEAAAAKVQIKFYAIVKPNAVLVIAPPAEMAGVRELAEQLDKPVIPETEFQVFPLKHGVAASVAKSVNDFYKGRTGLGTVVEAVADARTNSVIVQARPRDLEEVAKLITRLDGPTAATATLKVFTLTNGDAATIVRLLETLFTTGQRQGAAAQVPTTETGETPPTSLRLSADVRTNSIIAVGTPDTLRAVEAVIYRLDNTDAHQRETVVIKLKNNSSDAVAKAVNDFVTSERSVAQIDPDLVSTVELLEREVFIVSEPVSNSLLLSATPRYFVQLKKMIEKLDEPPRQVVIQAMIVEVTLTNDDEFGIELGFQSPVLFDRSTLSPPVTLQVTTSQNTNTTVANNVALSTTAAPGFQFTDPNLGIDGLGTNSIVNTSQVGTQELTNFGVGRTSANPTYGSGLVLAASSESVSFLLRALSYKDTVHVLSRPMIRTVDNQQASVQVGKNVPIIYGFTSTAVGSLAPIVRYDGAGIILQVWPRITPDGMIVMETGIEKSVYETGGVVLVTDATTGRTISSPVKDVTRAQATVSLASGETVVLGGLITSSDETTERKVPWVGDVPILGQLFRYDTKTTIRSELLIFLTPRVIRNDTDDEVLKQIETERLHFLLDEAESIHGPILSTQPQADGLLQQCPPLTMPSSQTPGAIPPAPGAVPPMAPPTTMQRSPQPTTPPELPPVLPPGVSPGPGVAPPVPMLPPAKPGAGAPVPRETYQDDPNVPTTQMPSTPVQVRPLGNPNVNGQVFVSRGPKPGDQAGTVRFGAQAAEADPNEAQPAAVGR